MHTSHTRRGFTLIELLVVFAIIISIMAVVFTSQGSFNKTFVLTNTAYDIALTLRNAGTYGLSSRAVGTIANVGYGLHFQNTTPNSFSFFADTSPAASCTTPDCKPGNYVYTNGSDSLVRQYVLGNGITLADFCAFNGSWSCMSAHPGISGGLTSLDIVFARPNPNPFMSTNGLYSSSITAACLTLSSGLNTSRYVSVTASGGITVNAASCP